MPDPTSKPPAAPNPDPAFGVDVYHEADTGFSRYVFYFPHNGTTLLAHHLPKIQELADELNEGKYFEVYALADRSGTAEVNHQVSWMRFNEVMNGLFNVGFEDDDATLRGPQKFLGEDFWAFMETQADEDNAPAFADGKRTADFRLVAVYVWDDMESSLHLHADVTLVAYGRLVPQPAM